MSVATLGKIAAYLESQAPLHWAEQWDNVGLQVGDPARPVSRILVALELTDAVLEEALRIGADLVLVHHPAIFRPLKALRFDTRSGRRLERLIRAGIGLYAAHTNLDQAAGGTNDNLARAAGLKEFHLLSRQGEERYLKLAVYVPRGHEDKMRTALAEAGAGHIGKYSHCTFQVAGTGTFLPLAGTVPFSGKEGELSYAEEYRLETILPQSIVTRVVAAMVDAHPYEEVAYDLYELAIPGSGRGHGRIGPLEPSLTLAHLAGRLKEVLATGGIRMVGDPTRIIQMVAVGAGAGGGLVAEAAGAGADVLVTGDISYHTAQDALDLGLSLIDVGHFASERIVLAPLAAHLQERLQADGLSVEVLESQSGADPFLFC